MPRPGEARLPGTHPSCGSQGRAFLAAPGRLSMLAPPPLSFAGHWVPPTYLVLPGWGWRGVRRLLLRAAPPTADLQSQEPRESSFHPHPQRALNRSQTGLAKCESGELGQSGGFCAGSRGCPGLRPGENAAGGKGGGRESGTAGRGSYQNCGVCDFRRQIKLLPLPRAPSCAAETQPGPREYTGVSSEARQGSGQSCLVPDTPCWPTPPGTSDVDVARGPGVGTPLSELTSFPKVNTPLCMQSSPMWTWWMCALKCQNQ